LYATEATDILAVWSEPPPPAEVAEYTVDGLREDRHFILPASEEREGRFRERVDALLARRNPDPPRLF
jgi:hypothetical protein